MICPFMTKDPVSDPKPCINSCALNFKNHCSLNVMAQSLYEQAKTKFQEKDRQDSAEK